MSPEKFITIKNEPESDLSKVDVGKLTSLLEKYNVLFGMGASLARQLTDPSESEDMISETQKSKEIETLEEMERQAEPILAATGLELVPANAGWSIISSDLQHKGKELRIDLKDGKRFVEYLRSLSPDKVSDSQVAGLEKVVSALTKQFRNEYDLTSADDNRMLEFLGNLSDIIDEYKRIGGEDRKDLADSVSQFEGYLKGSRGGFLREYLSAEKLLLNKPFDDEGFVLRWHIDASPEYLQKRWNEVIDLLQVISSNDRAPELYDQAKKTATEALDSAIREITEKHENGYMNADRKKKFLSILNSVKARMQEY